MTVQTLPGTSKFTTLTGANIITRVREKLNEPTAAFWNDTELLHWINDGIQHITSLTFCNGITEDVTLVADQLEYPLTNTYTTVIGAIYNGVKGLVRNEPRSVGHVNDVGVPVYFFEFDGNLGVFPIPAATSDPVGKTVKVYQLEVPSDISDSDSVPLPRHLVLPLIYYTIAQACYKDNTPVQNQNGHMWMSRFDGYVDRFRVDYSERGRDKSDEVGDII